MKTGRYNLKELLTHNEIEQIIIPEIQRDYVWQNDNVRKLLNSIIHNFNSKTEEKISIEIEGRKLTDNNLVDYLQKEYYKLRFNLKIGFIYAYHDHEYAGKFFLIDGQQRITTLFLLLLNLYIKVEKQKDFIEFYFKDQQLKVDYRVREASHDFLTEFVKHQLSDITIDFTDSIKYYNNEYDNDETIKNILSNYAYIDVFLSKQNIDFEKFLTYVEEFVETNYFDTNLSEQGEQLYLYMNSRGEGLSYHELIKSEIIKKIDKTPEIKDDEKAKKKKEIGKEWEDWQNFFWKYKGMKNENADIGFQEFLKWASVIQICTIENPDLHKKKIKEREREQSIREAKENYINRVTEKLIEQQDWLAEYQIKTGSFTTEYLKKIFEALEFLVKQRETYQYISIEKKWLANDLRTIDYVVLCPLLYYVSVNAWNDDTQKIKDIQRLSMFLKNLTYFESTLGRTPDSSCRDAIELIKTICDVGEKDIIHFLEDSLIGKFHNILTESERNKLERCKNGVISRDELEKFIWDITLDEELSKFIEGDISILFECFDYAALIDNTKPIDTLCQYKAVFENAIIPNKSKDIFRRALLSYGNYYIPKGGGSSHFGAYIERYSFIYSDTEWRYFFQNEKTIDRRKPLISIMTDLKTGIKANQAFDINDFFEQKINNYNIKDWKEPFIKEEKVLAYCGNKMVLYQNDKRIILLSKIIVSATYIELQTLLLQSKIADSYIYDEEKPGICVYDFILNSNKKIEQNKEPNNAYALDIQWLKAEWKFSLFHRNKNNTEASLHKFNTEPGWIAGGGLFTRSSGVFHTDDSMKSIMENVNDAKDEFDKLLIEIETILNK